MLWIIGYLLIGLLSMCAVQYVKGRGTDPRSTDILRDLNLDLLSWTVLILWPALLMMAIIFVVIGLGVCLPLWKVAEYFSALGKKHRGPKKHPMP